LTQILQIMQLILFSLPIIALLGIGVVILLRPVSILSRRWTLAVFLPLLVANPLALLENNYLATSFDTLDWRIGLILVADIVLVVGAFWISQGFMVYGITAPDAEEMLVRTLEEQGLVIEVHSGEKQVLGGRVWHARILSVTTEGRTEDIWITERYNEILIRADSRVGLGILKKGLPSLRKSTRHYDFKAHAMGILYIILAIVFAVLSWIFFFEPRFILID